jgi:alkanesulfonate monooxygenase SsuD/methylene tetrahydromethanopterin reductase-like flavin-dependent oxidoreductase (luciferase family)
VTIRLGLQIPNFSYDEGKRPTFSGKYYRTESAMAEPRFRDHIPLMIGGSGEKKTIPLAARHFDHLNVIAGFDELARKVEVKNRVCEELGRDPATLETSMLVTVMVDENATPDVIPDEMKQGMVVGGADAVAEQLKAKVFDAGVDGVIMNLPTSIQGYQPGHITALGEALKPLVSA